MTGEGSRLPRGDPALRLAVHFVFSPCSVIVNEHCSQEGAVKERNQDDGAREPHVQPTPEAECLSLLNG